MKIILIKSIKENDQTLDINVDLRFDSLENSIGMVSYHYNLEMLDYDFYYIGKSWLPFNIENPTEYVIYLAGLDSIDKVINLYTNIYDGIKMVDVVIIYMKNLSHRLLAGLDSSKIHLGSNESNLYSYFIDLQNFYRQIFDRDIICNIYCLNTSFEAVSFPSVIILSEGYLQRPKTYMYKFLPHEIFHQIYGCHLKFIGTAKEWMRESIVEYLQLIFLKECINTKFFLEQFEGYKRLESKWNGCNISIIDFDFIENLQYYKCIIYGRGVVIFHEIFGEIVDNIRTFTKLLCSNRENIDIDVYISNIRKATGMEKDVVMEKLGMKLLQ